MKLSDLLELGLKDLRRHERNNVVDMNDWLVIKDGICYACMAGAIIYWTLKEKDYPVKDWMRAIESLRKGHVAMARCYLYGDCGHSDLDREVADYHKDRKQFYKDMRKLLKDLKCYQD